MTPYVFRPFAGCARSVAIGNRVYLEGDLLLATAADVARLAPGYGGLEAFDRLTPRQIEALARAVDFKGADGDLVPYLLGLNQAALNEARNRVRGIGDDPEPIIPAATVAAPITSAPALEPALKPVPVADEPTAEPASEAVDAPPSETEADLMKRTLPQLLALVADLKAPITSEQKKTKGGCVAALRAAGHVKEG